MNLIPTNKVPITVDGQTYHFTIETPSLSPFVERTVVVLIDRHAKRDPILLPTFLRTYLAVDEGYTSVEIMGWLGRLQPSYAIMSAYIEDAADRSRFLHYFRSKIVTDEI